MAAAALMRKHHFRHLVVVDEHEKLASMLALRYLLYDLMDGNAMSATLPAIS